MSISNYPSGFDAGVSIRGLNVLNTYAGNVWWVHSATGNNASTYKGSYNKPFASIDYAVGRCSVGDLVMVKPGHTETISAAGGITLDVAGVTIVGLGNGTSRPTITIGTAATAEVVVSAANVTLKNLLFVANFADVANVFELTATDFTVDGCEFRAAGADLNFLRLVNAGGADGTNSRLAILNSKWVEADAATSTAVAVAGDLDGLRFENNYVNLGVNTSDLPIVAIVATGKDATNVSVLNNKLIRLNDANPLLMTFDTGTANTGIIAGNFVRHADEAGELLVTTTSNIGHFNNYATAVADLSGYILPAVDS